jgi:hypothetical protein
MPTDTLVKPKTERFLYVESSQIPLTEIPYGDIKENLLDPISGKPYKGIVLEGCFADLAPNPNNNKRVYDIPQYLELLKFLKRQIHSKKGVYGELEHPKGYGVNSKNISHKILDVWYDEKTQKVYGRIMLLNTPNGLIAQEIIRSGGQLAISARAAGEENELPNGTKSAVTKLLTTFDLVYHPGFSAAVLEFKELNESQKYLQSMGTKKSGFSGIIYEKDLKEIPTKFAEFISLNESQNCFLEWYLTNLNESVDQTEQQKEQKIIQQNEPADKQEFQDNLQDAVDTDLSESKRKFLNQIKFSENQFKKKKLAKSYYDDTAGFLDNTINQTTT